MGGYDYGNNTIGIDMTKLEDRPLQYVDNFMDGNILYEGQW